MFPYGTRKRIIRVQFSLDIEVKHLLTNAIYTDKIVSAPSKSIIVKTNENQWEESEGFLLKDDIFGNYKEATWFQFVNALQNHYLLATKQNHLKPPRPLTEDDFEYIKNAKFASRNNKMITTEEYDAFWQWFGPGLHKIRYQRHMCKLWVNGYICGFVPRHDAESLLRDTPPGTFLIRLSERIKGSFTVAYVAMENYNKKIFHYIISSDDVFGAKKTLPDFLGGESALEYLVQMVFAQDGSKKYITIEKDKALGDFYSKRVDKGTEGYDTKLMR